jgi:predicted dehydrogenase
MWAPHLPAKEALQTEAEHFVDCLCRGASPISSGLTGLHVLEILEATSRSITARGAPVAIRSALGKRASN